MTIFLKKYLLLKRHNGEGEAGESRGKADTLHISLYMNFFFIFIVAHMVSLLQFSFHRLIMGKVGRKTLRNRSN